MVVMMQNFLVRTDSAPFGTQTLSEKSIVYADYPYDGNMHYLFDEVMFNRLTSEVGLDVTARHRSSMEGVSVVEMKYRNSSTETKSVSDIAATAATVVKMAPAQYSTTKVWFDLTALEESLGRKIKVHRASRLYNVDPINDEFYHIWMYATPTKTAKAKDAKRTLLGKKWSREEYPLEPSNIGKLIIDTDGLPIAEHVENNLYVLYNLKYLDEEGSADSSVLQMLLAKTIFGEEDFIKHMREENFKQHQNDFIEFCSKMEFRRKDEIKQRVGELRASVSQASSQLIQSSKELKIVERDMVNYDNLLADAKPSYEREFARIRNISKIISLEINNQSLIVTTTPLTCEDPRNNKIHDMGSYKITIRLDNRYGIRFENLTRTIGGKHHPHVDGDNAPCLGNFNEVLPSLVMQNQFGTIIIMAIKFLESVNTDDPWGAGIVDWPVNAEYLAKLAAEGKEEPERPESEYYEEPDEDDEDEDYGEIDSDDEEDESTCDCEDCRPRRRDDE